MKVLAINGSPHKEGNTATLLMHILRSLEGVESEIVHLVDLDIEDCVGCMACKETGECRLKDDMEPIYESMMGSDILLLGSPIYMGAETGRMKCFLDRLYALLVDAGEGDSCGSKLPGGKRLLGVFTCGNPDGCIEYDHVPSRYSRFFVDRLGLERALCFVVPLTEESIIETCYALNLISAMDSLAWGEDLFEEETPMEVPEGGGVNSWGRDVQYPGDDEEDRLFSDEPSPGVRDAAGYYVDEEDEMFNEDPLPARCPRSTSIEKYPGEDDEDDMFAE